MFRRRSFFIALCGAVIVELLGPGGASSDILVTPAVTLTEKYDSNAYHGARGTETGDFITVFSPGVSLRSDMKKGALSATYGFDSAFYHSEPELNYTAHRAGVSMDVDISRNTSFGASDSFTYTPDSVVAFDAGILTRRTDIMANTMELRLDRTLGPGTTAGLALSESIYEIKDPALVDTRTDRATVSLGRSMRQSTTVRFSYEYANFTFDGPGDTTHTWTHSVRAGVSERFPRGVAVDVSGGVVYLPATGDSYDWTASAALTKAFNEGSLRGAYSRSVSHTSGLSDEVSINDRGTVALDYAIMKSLTATISGSISKTSSEPGGGVDVKSYSANAGLSWKPLSWVTVGAGYARFLQWAEAGAVDIVRDQVYASITVVPAEWRF